MNLIHRILSAIASDFGTLAHVIRPKAATSGFADLWDGEVGLQISPASPDSVKLCLFTPFGLAAEVSTATSAAEVIHAIDFFALRHLGLRRFGCQ